MFLSLGSCLGIPPGPTFRGAYRTKTGQPQVWQSVGKFWNSTPAKFCSGIFLSLSISSMLYLWYASLKEKFHSVVLTAYGHSMVVWRRRFRLPRVNSFILCSTIVFCWL